MRLDQGRSPILLTERRTQLEYFAERLRPAVRHVVVLRGGMTPKERSAAVERLRSIPDVEERQEGSPDLRLLDREVPLLARMFQRRLRAYAALGYTREAAPAMPAEITPGADEDGA